MSGLPSGTITFLFTDIEGSTKLWERYPEGMKRALARHDAILRAEIESRRGYVFKTVGDAFCAAFHTPEEALEATLAFQVALAGEEWGEVGAIKVRVGLHTGTAEERDRDYFGPTVNRVARLQSTAYGQQTVISGVLADALRGALPSGVTLLDLGEHRLKDLVEPEHVFQVNHPALPTEFPPIKSLDNIPKGIVTFLFSDIEGSTKLLGQFPEAYSKALLRHDAIMRGAIEGNRGYVFETVGDAFYAAFQHPSQALAAAVRAQVELEGEDWGEVGRLRVRMGLHGGPVELRGTHYFGAPLYRCARLMATGYGGQTLLSETTADEVREALPADVSLKGLGTHRLKDLGQPETIFQVLHPALDTDFPPLKSLDTLSHNLPLQLTSFVGRAQEMADVKALLGKHRLVTLLGPGGTGKTRLSIQAAADMMEAFPDGIRLVELAALTDGSLVAQEVALALGVKEEPGRPLQATLVEHLKAKQALVILDNCEQVIQECATLANALLKSCPHLRILATSREALGVPGEQTKRIPSLPLPDPKRLPPLEQLAENEAVRLFVERATTASPSFELSVENAPAVVQVCRQLDGIPLALELAAARVKVLKVDQIATRLDDRFRLLTGGSRALLPRQQTLRALVDWSHDLLSEPERAMWRRISVFAGGFSLEAAEAVCAGDPIEDFEVLDLVAQLVDKSIVVADDAGAEVRYRQLETLRAYGREKLAESGELEEVAAKHAAWFLGVVDTADPLLTGPQQAEWLARLTEEHDNMRAAIRSALDQGQTETALGLSGNLVRFWWRKGLQSEGLRWLDTTLSQGPEVASVRRAKALNSAGLLARQIGDNERARNLHERCLAMRRALGDEAGIAESLANLGVVAHGIGDYSTARARYEEGLSRWKEQGNRQETALTLYNLGVVARDQGDLEAGAEYLGQSLAMRREMKNSWGVAMCLNNLGAIARDQGDLPRALSLGHESIREYHALGERWGLTFALLNLGLAVLASGRPTQALSILAAMERLRTETSVALPPNEQERLDRALGRLFIQVGEDVYRAAWDAADKEGVDEAVERLLATAASTTEMRAGTPS